MIIVINYFGVNKYMSGLQCIICNQILIGKQTKFCSPECRNKEGNKNHQVYKKQKERAIKRKISLIKMLGNCCSECEYSKNLSALEFHHINPEEKDHTLDTRKLANCTWEFCLEEVKKCVLLCSNCHRETHNPDLNNFQTQLFLENPPMLETKRAEIKQKFHCLTCQRETRKLIEKCSKCIKKEKALIKVICSCGKSKNENSKLCKNCYNLITNKLPKFKSRKVERPSKEELEKLIWEKPFATLSKEFGVSDVAIKKWCKYYGINNFPPRGYFLRKET